MERGTRDVVIEKLAAVWLQIVEIITWMFAFWTIVHFIAQLVASHQTLVSDFPS